MMLTYPELIRILRSFALLLHSGISGADSAYLLAAEEAPHRKELLRKLADILDSGVPLSEALVRSGGFPEQVPAMVQVGEETGHLEEALTALADFYEQRNRTLLQIRSAVTYPATVFALMMLVVGVLLVKVLPVFDQVYASMGSRLTGPAAGLLYAGQLLDQSLPLLFGILLAIVVALCFLYFSPVFRKKLMSVWQKRYSDQGIARKFNNARFARAVAMGLSSGLPLEACMSLAEILLEHTPGAARRCSDCIMAITEGDSMGSAMERAQFLSPSQSRMLMIGNRSGCADRVMDQIAQTLQDEAEQALERRICAIEPAMVLVCSLLVGLILLSVMLPLADILAVLG